MPPEDPTPLEQERRLQAVGATLLGFAVLLLGVLRFGVGNMFVPGWWRFW